MAVLDYYDNSKAEDLMKNECSEEDKKWNCTVGRCPKMKSFSSLFLQLDKYDMCDNEVRESNSRLFGERKGTIQIPRTIHWKFFKSFIEVHLGAKKITYHLLDAYKLSVAEILAKPATSKMVESVAIYLFPLLLVETDAIKNVESVRKISRRFTAKKFKCMIDAANRLPNLFRVGYAKKMRESWKYIVKKQFPDYYNPFPKIKIPSHLNSLYDNNLNIESLISVFEIGSLDKDILNDQNDSFYTEALKRLLGTGHSEEQDLVDHPYCFNSESFRSLFKIGYDGNWKPIIRHLNNSSNKHISKPGSSDKKKPIHHLYSLSFKSHKHSCETEFSSKQKPLKRLHSFLLGAKRLYTMEFRKLKIKLGKFALVAVKHHKTLKRIERKLQIVSNSTTNTECTKSTEHEKKDENDKKLFEKQIMKCYISALPKDDAIVSNSKTQNHKDIKANTIQEIKDKWGKTLLKNRIKNDILKIEMNFDLKEKEHKLYDVPKLEKTNDNGKPQRRKKRSLNNVKEHKVRNAIKEPELITDKMVTNKSVKVVETAKFERNAVSLADKDTFFNIDSMKMLEKDKKHICKCKKEKELSQIFQDGKSMDERENELTYKSDGNCSERTPGNLQIKSYATHNKSDMIKIKNKDDSRHVAKGSESVEEDIFSKTAEEIIRKIEIVNSKSGNNAKKIKVDRQNIKIRSYKKHNVSEKNKMKEKYSKNKGIRSKFTRENVLSTISEDIMKNFDLIRFNAQNINDSHFCFKEHSSDTHCDFCISCFPLNAGPLLTEIKKKRYQERPIVRGKLWFSNLVNEYFGPNESNCDLIIDTLLKLLCSNKSESDLKARLVQIFTINRSGFIESLLSCREDVLIHCKETFNIKRDSVKKVNHELQQAKKVVSGQEAEEPLVFIKRSVERKGPAQKPSKPKVKYTPLLSTRLKVMTLQPSKHLSRKVEDASLVPLPIVDESKRRLPFVFDSRLDTKFSPGYIAGVKLFLPEGCTKRNTDTYEEFNLPPVSGDINMDITLIPISSLDKIGQAAFHGMTHLNKIQSIVFKTAYNTNENLLICAPTGAGKTNIALLAIIHEIKNNMHQNMIKKTEFKIIYVAPMKALATEMTANFAHRLKPLDITVREYTGDVRLSKNEIDSAQVIVTTPEKWDVLSRKKDVDFNLANLVRIIIIDEVHLLHGERGHVIEAIVARTLRQVESTQTMIRIVALSATLPNYVDVARFLRVNPEAGLFYFDSRFRPVPLHQCFIGVKPKGKYQREEMDMICYNKVVSMLKNDHQVMVFVHTRSSTVKTAVAFKNLAQTFGHLNYFCIPSGSNDIGPDKIFKSAKSRDLQDLYYFGLSVHHAGLVRSDRLLVEKYFRKGYIKVLICTSTLAWGVNLPAHAVIIKGTDMYDIMRGKYVDIGILDVLQIFGRAGRPQYDSSGFCAIITAHNKLSHYMSLLTEQFPIESQFTSRLPDDLNAEISLGTVTNVQEGIQWLSYTYLYVRMRLNPLEYGLLYDELQYDYDLVQKRESLIIGAVQYLDKSLMIRYNERTGDVTSTDIGRAASINYISVDTIRMFNENVKPVMDDTDVLNMVSMATEFHQIKTRQEELDELDSLLNTCIYPVKGGTENDNGKVNILIQCYLSRIHPKLFSLQSDLNYITQNIGRLTRALFDIALHKQNSILSGLFLKFCQMLEHDMWDYESELRQFSIVPFEIISKIEEQNLNVHRIREMEASDIGRLIRHQRMGSVVKECAKQFPLISMAANPQPITHNVLKVHILFTADFIWNINVHGRKTEFLWITIEDPKTNFIYHWEYVRLTRKQVMKNEVLDLITVIPLYDPAPSQYVVRAVFDHWLNSESSITFTIDDLVLPEDLARNTDILPLQPLPVKALNCSMYENLYKFTHFNTIQTQLFHCLYHTDNNVLLGAPTGSGKTVVAEIAFFRVFQQNKNGKIVYIAPLKALVKERIKDWKVRLEKKLNKSVVELTGDVTPDARMISESCVIVTTPEKWDGISRYWAFRKYVQDVVLIVIDEIHMLGEERGPVLEVIVSRTNFIAAQTNKKPRIIGLSTAIANPGDLANWLHIKENGFYNFRPSVRPVPLEVHVISFPGKHYCPRMAAMNKPAYRAIEQYSPDKPVLIFVSSRRQTRLTSIGLISCLAEDGSNKSWLRMKTFKLHKMLDTIIDDNLKVALRMGIGLHHAGLQESDRKTVEQLYLNRNIKVLIATATLAWGINLPAHLVIIKGTEYFDGKVGRFVDMPVTDILQMMGRAGRPQFDTRAYAVVMVHEVKKNYYKRFLYEPFPVESNLLSVLPEHLNAEIVSGMIKSYDDATYYLGWTYFSRRLLRNPSYYSLPMLNTQNLNEYLTKFIVGAIMTLISAGCASFIEETSTICPTFFGKIASYYYVSYKTMERFQVSLKPNMKIEEVFKVFCESDEFKEIPVRHNEYLLNGVLAAHCPIRVENSTLDSPHTKAMLMLQAHFSHLPMPCDDYKTDLNIVFDQSLRVLQALIDVAGEMGWLDTTINAQLLVQMIVQAQWYFDSPFLTLPHIKRRHLPLFNKVSPIAATLPGLCSVIRSPNNSFCTVFRQHLDSTQIKDVIRILESMPKISVQLSLTLDVPCADGSRPVEIFIKQGEIVNVQAGQPYFISTRVRKVNRSQFQSVYAPHFPKTKGNAWFLTLGDMKSRELLTMKRINLYKNAENYQTFNYRMPNYTCMINLAVFLVSDSYMGLDQQLFIKCNVT